MSLQASCDSNIVQPAASDGATLRIGGCTLDGRTGTLRRSDGTETVLRRKTVQLAELFAANAGALVSRAEILEAVWPGLYVTDDSITQCVVELRRAMGPAATLLRTIPRRGYVLDVPQEPARSAPSVIRSKPRISALPLSAPGGGDPTLAILGDWVAEEICRSLSRSSLLTVISHLSARAMASRMVDLAGVREVLGADYLLSGSIRRLRDEIVCDFDFIEVASGAILWTRTVVCPAAALTETLAERVTDVLQAIGRTIAETTLRNVRGRELPAIADHELLISGISLMHRPARQDFFAAERYLSEAASRNSASADAHAWLGKWHVFKVFNSYSVNRPDDIRQALDCTARALDLDPDSSFALVVDGFLHGNILRDFSMAARRYTTALHENPNESLGWLLQGALLAFQDEGAAAVGATEMARRLSPIDPFAYFYDSLASTAHLSAGNFRQALALADRSLAANNGHLSTLRVKVTAQHFLGDGAGARLTAAELRRRFPDFRLDDYRRTHPSADRNLGRRVLEALSASGIS